MVKKTSIGEICNILSGYAFDSNLFTEDSQDTPLIRIRDVVRGYTNTYTKESSDSKYIVRNGDLLIGMDGEFNIAPWKSDNAFLNQRVCKIWCSSNEVIEKYLFYFLPKALKDIERETSFVTVKHLSVKSINKIQIPLPSLETQKQIAQTLDTAAELLAMRKQQLEELDTLIKSTFYDIFGDPDNNPYSWDTCLLGETANIVSGITKGRKLREASTKPIPYMRVANVQDGHLNLSEIKQIEVHDSEIVKYQLINGDLLMTEGGDPDKLGRCAIWNGEIPICIHQNHIFRVRLNQELILPEYTSFLIGSIYGKKYFLKAAKQTTGIATINSKQLSKFPVLIPSITLQTQFTEIVTKIEEQKALVRKAIDETQYLFDSLMSEYFE